MGLKLSLLILVFLASSFAVDVVNGDLGFPVHYKFKGQKRSLSALKAHDLRRHGRFLFDVDLELGGNGLPSKAGLYYAKIGIGSPSKDYYVQVDTGSDILWVNCVGCKNCPKTSDLHINLTLYDPTNSSTSTSVTCDQPFCTSTYDGPLPGCRPNLLCQFNVIYGDGSSITGFFVKDTVQLDRVTGNLQTAPANGTIIFGCGAELSGPLNSSSGALDGVLGFGQANSSMISQLASAGKVKKMFAHCLDNINGGGIFAIGEVVQPKVNTTPLVPNQTHYNVILKDIEVGGDVLLSYDTLDKGIRNGTIIDSGTTLAHLPDIVYKMLVPKILDQQPGLKLQTVEGQFTCFQYNESVDDGFPTVTFHFEGSLSLTVYPHEYLFTVKIKNQVVVLLHIISTTTGICCSFVSSFVILSICVEAINMIDKSWMKLRNRLSNEYKNGVKEFLDFAFARVEHENMIPCPCVKCNNVWNKTREEVDDDLIINGIVKSYNFWIMHGEDNDELVSDEIVDDDDGSVDMDSTNEILEARFGATNVEMWRNGEFNGNGNEQPNEEATKFFKLLRDASEKVYPGCEKYSKLSFIVKFLHLKCLYHCSNECATMLLKLIGDVLPDSHTLPNNYYEAKKIVRDLGLDYEKIDACKNDCMLYWKDNANDEHCAICGESRWKLDGGARKGKKIPHKTLRYFPLTPRLQRLFMSKTTASEMTWHHEKRVDDGMLRHPADSKAWKHFNETHESFAIEPRNIRLGLASDGFNPFGNMSTSYSIWPVLLVPYNLPPWMCMKQPYTMLSLLIPGPNGPGNNIDIYLQPLIDELKMLWETGVETYDSYREQNFRMHAAVLWTINDFPAYGNLSGWVNKGKLACPSCNVDTQSMYLKNGGKTCYLGHRRFLPIKHRWRLQSNLFDGTKEKRHRPRQFSGDDVLDQLRHLHFPTFGKTNNKRKHNDPVSKYGWKKKSIFFELPYWRTLLLRHNLDVMHIEKNVCDNVLGLLMNTGAKDNIKARLDLKDMGIREELHPILKENKIEIPTASYTLSPNEKKAFCEYLKELKFPDGYASNISRCVNVSERKICGLKSHDSHVLLERFLPIAIRGLLPKDVCDALIELCTFFKEICCKVLSMDDLDRLESRIEFTLCKLEMIFPPAFFDIMEHLPIHLASEAKIAGPVQYRWMYQIERYMHKLKKFVRNKARPEGSIAEGYIADECLTFCSKHLHGIETRFNRVPRNYEGVDLNSNEVGFSIFEKTGRPLHKVSTVNSRQLELNEWLQARIYVLKNCDEVTPFLEEYRQEIEMMGVKNIEAKLNQDFPEWFEKRVTQWNNESNHLLSLAQGPAQVVTCYKGYIINGFRFHINDRATQRKTQNSGVVVKGECVTGDHDYYGVLTDIVELSYLGGHRVVLFKCDWWDVDTPERGIMKDAYGFTSVNVNRTLKTNEPFVLSCQAEQVYYVKDIKNTNWLVVVKNEPRDLYNMPNEENEEEREDGEEEFANNTEPYQQNESSIHHQRTDATYDDVVDVIWRRNDVQEEQVDANVLSQHTSNDIVEDDVLFDDDDDDDDESDVANSMTSDD